ncbi:Imm30 family immunity protein [Paenibacillus oryzisoli]|uniref:Imm30 family immunity protein n=1 Tax=Paenibacillus oryzisoli TaxID=1850517 RepID=UPI003D2860FE
MHIENVVQMLVENRLLRNEQEIVHFEEAIATISKENKVENIKYLCLGFDDKTEKDEVMFGLVHAIEAYDNVFGSKTTLTVLASSLPNMLPMLANG